MIKNILYSTYCPTAALSNFPFEIHIQFRAIFFLLPNMYGLFSFFQICMGIHASRFEFGPTIGCQKRPLTTEKYLQVRKYRNCDDM